MSQPKLIVQQCVERGIRLYVDGDSLKAEPRHLINDELIGLLRQHKPELIACLKPSANDIDVAGEVKRLTIRAAEGLDVSPTDLEALLDDIDHQAIAQGAADEYLNALIELARGEHKHRQKLNQILSGGAIC